MTAGLRFAYVRKVLILFFVYFVTAKAGLSVHSFNHFATLLWAPSGIALASLLIFGVSLWPGILVAALIVNHVMGASWMVAGGIAVGNTLEAVVGAYLCSYDSKFHNSLDRVQDIMRLFVRGAGVSTLISATIGVGSLYLGGVLTRESVESTWLHWWAGDVMGDLTIAPLLLIASSYCINQKSEPRCKGVIRKIPVLFALFVSVAAIWSATHEGQRLAGWIFTGNLFHLILFVLIVALLGLLISYLITKLENEKESLEQSMLSNKTMIFELERAKKAADAASAAKSAFLANMSHEIRTPLGVVLGFSELMLSAELTLEERVSATETIKRNGRLLSNIINDILDLSKVEAGKLDIEKVDVPFDEVITDVTSLLDLEAAEKGLELTLVSEGPVPTIIHTDPLRLRQILLNVVGNAIKFTERGSVEVIVKLLPGPNQSVKLAFIVRDTGGGIAPAHAKRLFAPFTQADVSTTRRFGGTGLGLVLSKRLAATLDGDVVLTESIPGFGSVFTVTIDPGPVEKMLIYNYSPHRSPTKTESHEKQINLEKLKILLVDDSADNQALVCRYLKSAGAHVEMARNGREGVEMALANEFSLVLMDLQMPEMDGYEATHILRKKGYKKAIIALTAHAMKEERNRCLAGGFNDHLSKPIDRGMLLRLLSTYS